MAYILSITSIAVNTDNTHVDSMTVGVSGRTGDPLTVNDFSLQKLNGSTFENYTTFTIADGATATAATINFTSPTMTKDDLILAQVITGDKSNRISVDFAETFTNDSVTQKYALPGEEGNYILDLNKLNGQSYSNVKSSSIHVLAVPTDSGSITLNKSYLTFFTNQVVDISINVNGAEDGTYETIISADPQ